MTRSKRGVPTKRDVATYQRVMTKEEVAEFEARGINTVRIRFARKNDVGQTATLKSELHPLERLVTLDEYVQEQWGGGRYYCTVKTEENDALAHVNFIIEGNPLPRPGDNVQRAWAKGLPAAQQGVYLAKADQVEEANRLMVEQAKQTGSISSDALLLKTNEENKVKSATLEERLNRERDDRARERREFEKQLAEAREAEKERAHKADLEKLRLEMQASRAPEKSGPSPEMITAIGAVMGPIAATLTTLLSANKDRELAMQQAQQQQNQQFMTLMMTAMNQEKKSELAELAPLMIPLLQNNGEAEARRMEAQQSMMIAMTESSLAGISMNAELINAMAGGDSPDKPWWADLIIAAASQVEGVAEKVMAAQQEAMLAQREAQARKQRGLQMVAERLAQPKPTVTQVNEPMNYAPPSPPPVANVEVNAEDALEMHLTATRNAVRELVSTKLPAHFHQDYWIEALTWIHAVEAPIDGAIDAVMGALLRDRENGELAAPFGEVFNNPGQVFGLVLPALPIWKMNEERGRALVEALTNAVLNVDDGAEEEEPEEVEATAEEHEEEPSTDELVEAHMEALREEAEADAEQPSMVVVAETGEETPAPEAAE